MAGLWSMHMQPVCCGCCTYMFSMQQPLLFESMLGSLVIITAKGLLWLAAKTYCRKPKVALTLCPGQQCLALMSHRCSKTQYLVCRCTTSHHCDDLFLHLPKYRQSTQRQHVLLHHPLNTRHTIFNCFSLWCRHCGCCKSLPVLLT